MKVLLRKKIVAYHILSIRESFGSRPLNLINFLYLDISWFRLY